MNCQVAHYFSGIDFYQHPVKNCRRVMIECLPVNGPQALFPGKRADKNIFSDRQRIQGIQFLINDPDPSVLGIRRILKYYFFTIKIYITLIS